MWVRGLVLIPVVCVAFQAQASESCMRPAHALPAGTVPTWQGFVPVRCGDAKPASVVRYDAGMQALRLTRDVHPDEVVAGIPPAMMSSISPGQKLYMTVQVGPVLVQREVEALQPANPGQKLFVRAADGKVITALYAGSAE